ncbi:MAG: hypothetical protein H6742_22010 [Alphaproteobacteria bacterium]|nr:hypothetical protein [Alphaproteobacteria bacterium]
MADFLAQMAAASRVRAEALDEGALALAATRAPLPPRKVDAFALIAEVKRVSPSEGALNPAVDPVAQAVAYAKAGAWAVSVLTEPSRFGGSLEDLSAVAEALRPLGVPAMRKDFIVDRRQVLEARAAGAGGILLIATMLPWEQVRELAELAMGLSMFVLVETFGADELSALRRRVEATRLWRRGNDLLLGVNCRDLRTLQVDPDRFPALRRFGPGQVVAESGLSTPDDVRRVAALGYRGALVGSALMRADDPGAAAVALRRAGQRGFVDTTVKLCGLRTRAEVDAAVRAGADQVGFVVVDSPRQVSVQDLPALVADLPVGVESVAVMRDYDQALIDAVSPHVDIVQCRAESLPDPLPRRRRKLTAVYRDGPDLLARLEGRRPGLGVLIDAATEGSGELADRDRVAAALQACPSAVLAGGLSPANVADVMRRTGARSVDVSSGIEASPGVKDPARMAAFVRAARLAFSSSPSSSSSPSASSSSRTETP